MKVEINESVSVSPRFSPPVVTGARPLLLARKLCDATPEADSLISMTSLSFPGVSLPSSQTPAEDVCAICSFCLSLQSCSVATPETDSLTSVASLLSSGISSLCSRFMWPRVS